ncbi:MAG: heavy-metal-associated domain-containing protein [Clostridium sp.]|nr:heavy-metal-associated domain-containing protein [Clostridium sp.]MCM1443840.1 heavy-metal-associated domain-containing protein [Candidatus Amulumruptor caecigallinarius]
MKNNYRIEGLDCVNCAIGLERAISKIEGVKQVNINFMMQIMELEYDENNKDTIIKKVKETIKKEEPDVEIVEI